MTTTQIAPSALFRTRRFTEYVGWLSDAKEAAMTHVAETEGPENEKSDVSVTLKWVYGINMNTNPPIQYAPFRATAGKMDPGEAQLVYSSGATVIVYNPQTHKQQYYLEHRHAISSIAISANKKYVASAEHNGISGKATIHIWNTADFSNAAFICSSHRGPILAMAFTGFDQYLLTIGATKPAPLILHKWREGTVLDSALVYDTPLYLEPKRTENDNIVEIVAQTQIVELRIIDGSPTFEEYCRIQPAEIKQETMTSGTLIHTNETMPRLSAKMSMIGVTGHHDGEVVWWAEGKVPTPLANYQSQITAVKALAEDFAVATASGAIYIV